MNFRKRMSKRVSRKQFRRRSGVHRKNVRRPVFRGGIAL